MQHDAMTEKFDGRSSLLPEGASILALVLRCASHFADPNRCERAYTGNTIGQVVSLLKCITSQCSVPAAHLDDVHATGCPDR